MLFKKGRHYCTPFPFPKFYSIKPGDRLVKDAVIRFDSSIKYDLGIDQYDVNKLFGYSYGLHHTNSDRIGFRYLPIEDKIELVLYSYTDGVRDTTKSIVKFQINEVLYVKLDIDITDKGRRIYVYTKHKEEVKTYLETKISKSCKIGYTLGGYFGGNNVAPHDIKITVNGCN